MQFRINSLKKLQRDEKRIPRLPHIMLKQTTIILFWPSCWHFLEQVKVNVLNIIFHAEVDGCICKISYAQTYTSASSFNLKLANYLQQHWIKFNK